LRRRLKEAEALFDAGRREGPLPVIDEILASADATRYCPLRAEALVVKADIVCAGDVESSLSLFEQAVDVAEACGHDRVVARASTELVFTYSRID
jgi:hypothetical protein